MSPQPPASPSGSAPAPRPPLWTGQFALVGVTYFFVAMIFYLLMTAMALYAVTRFAASEAQAGIAVGAFVLGAVVTRMTTTPAALAWGRRRVLIAALALYVLTSVAYFWADSLPALTAVRFLNGMCFGAAGTVLATTVQAIVPPSRRSEGTGWFSTSMTLAGAVGPLLALQLSTRVGYDALFWAATASTAVALGLSFLLRVPGPTPTGRFRLTRAGVFSREAAPVSVVIMFAGFAYGGVLAFLLGYAVSFALLALWRSPAGMLAAGLVLGLSYGPVVSVFQTIAVQVAPPAAVGVATGTFFLFLDLGTGIGPMVLGAVVAAAGVPAMYLACAGLTLALVVYYRFAHGRRPIAGRPSGR